jgi:hypothetical protein
VGNHIGLAKTWCQSWALVNGHVLCAECKNSQAESDADSDFQHAADCPASESPQKRPWEAFGVEVLLDSPKSLSEFQG